MSIDHEAHKIRVKAVSERMNHPMTYNDAGAPKSDYTGNYESPKYKKEQQKIADDKESHKKRRETDRFLWGKNGKWQDVRD